jgi:hypothetical protein
VKRLSTRKSPGIDGFLAEFYQTLERNEHLLILFQKTEEQSLSVSFHEANITLMSKPGKGSLRKPSVNGSYEYKCNISQQSKLPESTVCRENYSSWPSGMYSRKARLF